MISAAGPGYGQQAAPLTQTSIHSVAEKITAEQLRDYLYFIASDELEGRDTPSRELDIAGAFSLSSAIGSHGLWPNSNYGSATN